MFIAATRDDKEALPTCNHIGFLREARFANASLPCQERETTRSSGDGGHDVASSIQFGITSNKNDLRFRPQETAAGQARVYQMIINSNHSALRR